MPRTPHSNWLPLLPAVVWFCGFAAVLANAGRRWWQVRGIARTAPAVPFPGPVEVRSAPSLLEPGIFGVFRQVLLLPEGISVRLRPAEIEAILAHELCHVRRRDNFTAALHLLVEAFLWFYPLIWWIGARLVAERERACDEEVLRQGSEPGVYAEGILKVCRFYLESPLQCVSGVTGSDLKKRIEGIMRRSIGRPLGTGRKLLVAAAGIAAAVIPLTVGVWTARSAAAESTAPQGPTFEVASIKPNKTGSRMVTIGPPRGGRFEASNISLKALMRFAYHVGDFQISGGPGWAGSERFDLEAEAEGNPDRARLQAMMRALLADRFHLAVRSQTRELPVYALTVSGAGSELKPDPCPGAPTPESGCGQLHVSARGQITGKSAPLSSLAGLLSSMLSRPVLDQTGRPGEYDFDLRWTPDTYSPPGAGAPPEERLAPSPDPNGPTIFTALQEQLGLKLESRKGPVEMLVIEHADRPSAN